MNAWRSSVGAVGFDLNDGFRRLRDLRLAFDILLFVRSAYETVQMLDDLVTCLDHVGLSLPPTSYKDQWQCPARKITGSAPRSGPGRTKR